MPGTPDPVVGGSTTTVVLAVLVATALVGGAVALLRYRPGWPTIAVGAAGYGAGLVGLWAGVRVATGVVGGPGIAPVAALKWGLIGAVVLGVHAGLALSAAKRWGLVGPLAVLFVAATLAAWMFLQVRGESDPLGVYLVLMGPVTVVGMTVVAAVEAGGRRLLGVVGGPA